MWAALSRRKALQDTLTISLGRDKNIVVADKKMSSSRKRNPLARIQQSLVVSRSWHENKKSQAIKPTLFDQIPLSVISRYYGKSPGTIRR